MILHIRPARGYCALPYALFILFLTISFGGFAQPDSIREKPYQLRGKLDVPLLSIGTVGSVTGVLLREQHSPLDAGELAMQNASEVWSIDRSAVDNYSDGARIASDGLLAASYAAPLALLAFEEARSDAGTLGIMLLETILLNETLTGMTKALVTRPRPYTILIYLLSGGLTTITPSRFFRGIPRTVRQ